jgi:hypothetical protein
MDIKKWVLNTIPSNGIIIEAGTSEGGDTIFFSEIVTEGKVFAFEPVFNLYNTALKSIENRHNVNLYNLALSNKNESSVLYISDRFGSDWGSSSLYKPKDVLTFHPQITFNNEQKIQSVNLDDFFKDKSINLIDLMWLDLQGAEPLVLRAAPTILSKTKYLYTEVSLIEMYEGIETYDTYKQFLINSGFEILFEDISCADQGNVLFKNKNL